MKVHNITGLRESLEQLDTTRLDEMLQSELEKASPDPDAVRLIVSILEEREDSLPKEIFPQEQIAWQQYKTATKRPARSCRWLAVAASAVLAICLLFTVVPQEAEAGRFWEMLQRWSATVLEFLNPRENITTQNYVFETDNAGLQHVYDAVVEMGITEPVVPMWLPDGSELLEKQIYETPMSKGLHTRFSLEDGEIIFHVDVYVGEPAHQYYKDDTHYETYERNGTIFNIARNITKWTVVWSNGNVECLLTLDCQEDALRRILESIYVMEDKNETFFSDDLPYSCGDDVI